MEVVRVCSSFWVPQVRDRVYLVFMQKKVLRSAGQDAIGAVGIAPCAEEGPGEPLMRYLNLSLPNLGSGQLSTDRKRDNLKAFKREIRHAIYDKNYEGRVADLDLSRSPHGKWDFKNFGRIDDLCNTFTRDGREEFLVSLGQGGEGRLS